MRLKNYFPLCFVSIDIVLMYHYGKLCLMNIRTGEKLAERRMISSFMENVVAHMNIASRALRLGARLGTYIGGEIALVVVGKTIYEVNTKTLERSRGYTNMVSRPFAFGVTNGLKGFDDGVYWGEYRGNPNMNKISIYKRTGVDSWKSVYEFGQGEITHVHNVVPDYYRNCIWIFTGDFDKGAAIWKATDNFSKVEPIARSNQLYRACVVFPMRDGLLYATDAPFAQNYIMKMDINSEKYNFRYIKTINGSCIYGVQIDDETYVFQTAVEPDGRTNSNKLVFFFGRKRGAGIKDDYVCLYAGNQENGFKVVYRAKKDKWPYILFQFGTFQFPEYSEILREEKKVKSDKPLLLPFYSMAVCIHNMETQILELISNKGR